MTLFPKNNGFRRRALASIIDSFAFGCIFIPLVVIMAALQKMDSENNFTTLINVSYYLVSYGLGTLVLGWFNKHKGGGPGKILFGLQVLDKNTGARIGYGKTFLRDILGKILSSIILCIGYLMVIFRKDKRALHDLLADTQVVYVGKSDEKQNI